MYKCGLYVADYSLQNSSFNVGNVEMNFDFDFKKCYKTKKKKKQMADEFCIKQKLYISYHKGMLINIQSCFLQGCIVVFISSSF